MILDRSNKTLFGQWWWTVDRVTLLLIGLILSIGTVLVMASSPTIAESRGLPNFYFVQRQSLFLIIASAIIFSMSLLSPVVIRRISLLGVLATIVLLVVVLVAGPEVKGAKRWINLFGINIQPSEFLKPFFRQFQQF